MLLAKKSSFGVDLTLYDRGEHDEGKEKLPTRRHVRPMPSLSQLVGVRLA